jgi:putative ABC transport system permease protein
VLFVLVLLRRFKRISAVTALSSGATSQQSGGRLRLHRSRMPVHLRLGTMDVIGRWPTYLLLFFVFAVSTFIMIVPVNSATTANAPDFINYMGIGTVDLRIDLRHTTTRRAAQFADIVEQLEADPDVAAIAPMVTTRNDTVDRDGNAASLYIENGDHTRLPLTYADGRAPTSDSEIALSLLALNQSGREVGDTLPVEVGGQVRELTIVGSYQDITNGGKTAKSVAAHRRGRGDVVHDRRRARPGDGRHRGRAGVRRPARAGQGRRHRAVADPDPRPDRRSRSRSPPSSRRSSRSRSPC